VVAFRRVWTSTTRLPHVLPPSAYADPAHHARELAAIFEPGWHLVGTVQDIPRPDDFVTLDLLGRPLLVRNHDGVPRTFINVCAHRHTLLVSAPCGSAARIRCPYHGWEYDRDGGVCKMPDAACFAPVRRGGERLVEVTTATLGSLVFVRFSPAGPSLEEHLGERAVGFIRRVLHPDRRQAVSRALDHPCNWKILIENVLESYHVPLLHDNVVARHPEVFRFFRGAPAEGGESHELGDRWTAVHDVLGGDSALYRRLVRIVRPGARLDFVHLHVFPNLLLGETALVAFAQAVSPTSPRSSRSLVRIALDLGQEGRGRVERLVAPLADRVTGALFAQLMREDGRIFEPAQRGMAGSPQPGVLGAREERIHRFQSWVASTLHG
jgi:choline monooxygenase